MRRDWMQWHNRRVGAGESEPRAELIATVVCPEWPIMMPVFHMPQQQRIKGRDFVLDEWSLCYAAWWRNTGIQHNVLWLHRRRDDRERSLCCTVRHCIKSWSCHC